MTVHLTIPSSSQKSQAEFHQKATEKNAENASTEVTHMQTDAITE
jgi:hypothetical protein